LDQRARLSVVLLVIAVATATVIATGAGARDELVATTIVPAPPAGPVSGRLSAVASPAEMKLWRDRGCVTCHGPEATGGPMAPDLTKVVPLYKAKFGASAADRLEAYLIDPQGAPKLRDDGQLFPNPMPAIEKLFGGTKADARTLAALLLRLAN
jgi:mono/diheme cytochrome c family protein